MVHYTSFNIISDISNQSDAVLFIEFLSFSNTCTSVEMSCPTAPVERPSGSMKSQTRGVESCTNPKSTLDSSEQ